MTFRKTTAHKTLSIPDAKRRRATRYALLALGLSGLTATPALADTQPFVLDFERLGVFQTYGEAGINAGALSDDIAVVERVADFYNGGTGGSGTGPGPDFGVTFSDNALALQDSDADDRVPDGNGNFGGEPTGDNVLFFLTGDAATMNYAPGFSDGFSFFYSSFRFTGSIEVYSGLDGTGDVLASLTLPTTPFRGAPDPNGDFSPFVPIGIDFEGVARSIDFGGTINQIAFDNITFGADVPIETNTVVPIDNVDPDKSPNMAHVPSPSALTAGMLLLTGLVARRRRSADTDTE